jgi:hypothetical protein
VRFRSTTMVVAFYAAISLLVMLPLLSPGYVFLLDMVFGPYIPMPSTAVCCMV